MLFPSSPPGSLTRGGRPVASGTSVMAKSCFYFSFLRQINSMYSAGIGKHVCINDIAVGRICGVTVPMATSDHEKCYFVVIATVFIH